MPSLFHPPPLPSAGEGRGEGDEVEHTQSTKCRHSHKSGNPGITARKPAPHGSPSIVSMHLLSQFFDKLHILLIMVRHRLKSLNMIQRASLVWQVVAKCDHPV